MLRSSTLFPADVADTTASRPKREKKEAFKIDFLTPVDEDLKSRKKKLFAAPARGDNTLPASGKARKGTRGKKSRSKDKEEKRNNQTLPDDMHFSSRQLVTLFLKPKFSVCSSRDLRLHLAY